jgi:lysozyme
MRFIPRRRSARTMPARVTAVALFGSAATVAGLVAADVLPAPSWADLDGVDVASHQHSGGAAIDWQTVAASGQSFAFIKATEGTGYVNPYFSSDSSKASAAGILPGSYHYAKPGLGDARSQARYYASTLATGAQPSLPPTLDLEENGGLSADQLTQWVHDWVDEITTLTGRDPIIYTYYAFWLQDMGNTTEFSDLPLWLAYYGDSLPDPLPGGWSEATFWQYTGEGAVDGVYTNVDMNTYYGSDAQLQSLAGRPSSGTSAGDVADALKPITDAGTGEAGIANSIEHGLAAAGLPALDIPLSTDVLVDLLGLVAGQTTPEQFFTTLSGSGILDTVTSQALTAAGAEAGKSGVTLPKDQIQSLVSSALAGDEVNLGSILDLLTAFGAQDYKSQIAAGTLDAGALAAETGTAPATQPNTAAPAAPAAPAVPAAPAQ